MVRHECSTPVHQYPKIIFNQSGSANSKTDHVYVQQGPIITVYDIDGREQRSFEIPSEIKFYLSFYILTDGRIAFFDARWMSSISLIKMVSIFKLCL